MGISIVQRNVFLCFQLNNLRFPAVFANLANRWLKSTGVFISSISGDSSLCGICVMLN